jgi:hypothetical protein
MTNAAIKVGARIVLQSAYAGSRNHFAFPGLNSCICGTYLPKPVRHCEAIIESSQILKTQNGEHRVKVKTDCLECAQVLYNSLHHG